MHHEIRDNQLYLHRLPKEKEKFIQRLNRIEGQVRGLHRMIENDRYCGDAVQQVSAISAAVRELTLLLISQHLETGIPLMSKIGGLDGLLEEETLNILRGAMSLRIKKPDSK
jgi:CsoR family transcriptional regulator, copper-sensing transcriptional repressor